MTFLTFAILHCGFVTQDIVFASTAAILNIQSHIQVAAPTNIHPTMQSQMLEEPKLQLSLGTNSIDIYRMFTASGQLLECAREWSTKKFCISSRPWIHIRIPGWSIFDPWLILGWPLVDPDMIPDHIRTSSWTTWLNPLVDSLGTSSILIRNICYVTILW